MFKGALYGGDGMIYFVLIEVWPLVNYLEGNFDKLAKYGEFFILAFTLVSIAVLTYFVAKKILKRSVDRLILPIFFGTALYFLYGEIVRVITEYNIFFSIRASYVYCFIVMIILWFAWKISSRNHFQKMSKILVCVVFAVSLVNLTKTMVKIICNLAPAYQAAWDK